MKILYYSSHPQLKINAQSGPGTHMREMIEAMRHLGHEVLPVIMGDLVDNSPSSDKLSNRNWKATLKKIVPGIIWRSLKDLQLIRFDKYAEETLLEKIKTFNPELVYERGAYLQLSGVNATRKMNIKHFIEINAPFLEEVRKFEKAPTFWFNKAKQIEKLQIALPSKVFVVSTALKEYFSKYVVNKEKIVVTPNSVNPQKIVVDTALKKILDLKLDTKNRKIIGFVGSIFPYHGVDILIEAFRQLINENKDALLLIVGDGIILSDLKMQAKELGLEKEVIFTGSVKHAEVFTYIDVMDICVMAKTNWYCSPVKIFEYGAMGKAIVASNTVSVKDVMENDRDGILIEPDMAELTKALKKLLDENDLRSELAEHFKQKVLMNYTWTNTASQILKQL